jgi:hypothetical protein
LQRTLEETAALFDGDEKVAEIHARAAADSGLTGKHANKTPSLDEKASNELVEKL